MEDVEKYISKEELVKRGFEKGADGIYRMPNVLETYARNGQLGFGDKMFSADDRVAIGKRFYADFYKSRLSNQGALNLLKVRVDGERYQNLPEYVLDARNRFFKAIRAIPTPYVSVVCRVCLEDKKIKVPSSNDRLYRHNREVALENLCLGLDHLIYHYKGRTDSRHRKPSVLRLKDFWNELREYAKKLKKH